MMTNANFIGDERENITVIADTYTDHFTTLQSVEREVSEQYPTSYKVTQVTLNPAELFDLITALTTRYNDLPAQSRDNVTVELRRVVSSESDNQLRF